MHMVCARCPHGLHGTVSHPAPHSAQRTVHTPHSAHPIQHTAHFTPHTPLLTPHTAHHTPRTLPICCGRLPVNRWSCSRSALKLRMSVSWLGSVPEWRLAARCKRLSLARQTRKVGSGRGADGQSTLLTMSMRADAMRRALRTMSTRRTTLLPMVLYSPTQ